MKSVRKFSMLAVAMVALSLSAGFAHADSSVRGRFKLPVDAHCKGVLFPAGAYTYSLQYSGGMTVLFIRSTDGKVGAFLSPVSLSTVSSSGPDELLLTRRGSEMFLSSFALHGSGVELHYAVPSSEAMSASSSKGKSAGAMLASAGTK